MSIDLQAGIPQESKHINLFRPDGSLKSLAEVEEQVIRPHLEYSGKNMSQAALTLDIGRSTLYRKIEQFRRTRRALTFHVG